MIQLLDNVEIHHYDSFQWSTYFFKVMNAEGECVYDSSEDSGNTHTYECVFTCTRGYLEYIERQLTQSKTRYSSSDLEKEISKVKQQIKDYKIKE